MMTPEQLRKIQDDAALSDGALARLLTGREIKAPTVLRFRQAAKRLRIEVPEGLLPAEQ
jgi:hypothetical protein